MASSSKWKKKIQSNKNTSILLTIAIIIVGGLIMKVIADKESDARIDY